MNETEVKQESPEDSAKCSPDGKGWRRVAAGAVLLLTLGGIPAVRWHRQSTTREYFQLCRQATAMEDWQTLGRVATDWHEWDPDSVDAAIFLAEYRSQRGELAGAVELLTSLPDDSPKTPAALLIAVDLLFQELNRPREAVALAGRLAGIAPDVTGVRQRIIFFYALTLQRQALIDTIRQSIEDGAESPDAYVYLVLANHLTFSNGPQINARWSQSAPDDMDFRAAYLIQRADSLLTSDSLDAEQSGELQTVLREIEALADRHPDHEALVRFQLFLASRNDDAAEVGRILNSVPAGAWEDSVLWRYRGWFHHRNGELSEAESAYQQAREMFPMDWQTWQGLSAVQRRLGKLDEAETSQEIALEGKELRKHLLQLPDAGQVDPETLDRIRAFAAHCGDRQVAEAVGRRLAAMNYAAGTPDSAAANDAAANDGVSVPSPAAGRQL